AQCAASATVGTSLISRPLGLSVLVQKTTPSSVTSRNVTKRAEGVPSALTVARLTAVGSGTPSDRAVLSHERSRSRGSAGGFSNTRISAAVRSSEAFMVLLRVAPCRTSTDNGAVKAAAYWTVGPGRGEIRPAFIDPPAPDEVQVRALYSAISRGTESLVHRHAVPESVRHLMRAPFQEGDLPGPVKYGYLSVGIVERGPAELRAKRVFCLHPHQSRYVVPAAAVVPVPDDVPSQRAVLAGPVETAVN